MYDWLLNNAHFLLLVLSFAAVITIGLIVTALTKVRRAEFARLQDEVKELSELVKALEVAEQRRFLKELNSHSERAEPSVATNALKVSAISESRPPDLQLLKPEKEAVTAPPLVP
jgi:uncharacterized membrane protein (DUF106 family)